MDPMASDPTKRGSNVEWITIRTYLFEYEAVFARDLLRAHGLRAQILDAGFIGVAPHMANSVGGVRLQADLREAEDARKILDAPHVVPDPPPEDEEGDGAAGAEPLSPPAIF